MYEFILSIFGCFILSFGYVSGLYVWGSHSSRNLPSTIKKRFISCGVIMIIAPYFVKWTVISMGHNYSILKLLGLRTEGILQAASIPLLLTALLFLGPLSVRFLEQDYEEECYSANGINLIWWRNYIVSPFSEEFIFRSCMLAVLFLNFTPSNSIALSSFFFGAAHLHHIYSNLYEGYNLKSAVLIVGFQVIYTTIFGAYSAFLFLRTGHFIAPFLAHSFCNYMGFPNIHEVFTFSEPKRTVIAFLYVLGLISWIYLLVPATNPEYYGNDFHWPSYKTVHS